MDRIGVIEIERYIKPGDWGDFISYNQFIKIKPKPKIIRAKGVKWRKDRSKKLYQDKEGCFYYFQGNLTPSKEEIEEFEKFKGNKNAVLVNWAYGEYSKTHLQWFESIEEFLLMFYDIKQSQPAWYSSPYYFIEQIGYKKVNPKDAKRIYKLPYFDIDNFPKKSPSQVSWHWTKAYPEIFHSNCVNNIWAESMLVIEDIVEYYHSVKKELTKLEKSGIE